MTANEKEEILERLERVEKNVEKLVGLVERATGMWIMARWIGACMATFAGAYWWASDHIAELFKHLK